jgi:hypothetical protein
VLPDQIIEEREKLEKKKRETENLRNREHMNKIFLHAHVTCVSYQINLGKK